MRALLLLVSLLQALAQSDPEVTPTPYDPLDTNNVRKTYLVLNDQVFSSTNGYRVLVYGVDKPTEVGPFNTPMSFFSPVDSATGTAKQYTNELGQVCDWTVNEPFNMQFRFRKGTNSWPYSTNDALLMFGARQVVTPSGYAYNWKINHRIGLSTANYEGLHAYGIEIIFNETNGIITDAALDWNGGKLRYNSRVP